MQLRDQCLIINILFVCTEKERGESICLPSFLTFKMGMSHNTESLLVRFVTFVFDFGEAQVINYG
jgi:hypothetical protein